MGRSKYLTELEELTLRAVIALKKGAYGVSIREKLADAAEREVSFGALYRVLERLEEAGYLKPRKGEATPERGGRAKTYYDITGLGERAVKEADARLRQLNPKLRTSEI